MLTDDDHFYRPPTAPIAPSGDYSYIKESYRAMLHDDRMNNPADNPTALQNGFTGLRFHLAMAEKVLLTWRQRWAALNRFEWRQFYCGVRLEVHICTPPQDTGDPRKRVYCGDLVVSKYTPGGEVPGE